MTKWRSLQNFDRKRLQIDGLFKPRCGSPPRVPALRRTAFIATNAAQTQLPNRCKRNPDAAQIVARRSSNRCQTQLKSLPNAAQIAAKRSSNRRQTQLPNRCKRSSDVDSNAANAASNCCVWASRRCVQASRHCVWMQNSRQNAGLRLTRSNTSWTVPKPFPTIWGDHNSTQEWFKGRLHPISPT